MRVGAIDVGTNSIRLLVADFREARGTLETVARAGEACRLGRGLDRLGRIDDEIAARAGAIVTEFARRARHLGATHLVVGGTAALRSAANGRDVAARIGDQSGEQVRILSGEEEARLVYESVVLGLGGIAGRSPCVVFDIGGGSTEIVSGVGERAGRWTSLPFGAVSLTEKHLTSQPPSPAQLDELRARVNDDLMHHCALMPASTPLLAGVGGTMTVLASLDRGLTAYDPVLLEGWPIEPSRLEALVDRIVGSTEEERRAWTVMGQGRSDIVVAGAIVVGLISRRFPSRRLVCSTQGLRYGLARAAARELGSAGDPADHIAD
jgi:exopolyphosphatase/guanosine-5'-triphosphate,3'-diphosphate pyrophosphatase